MTSVVLEKVIDGKWKGVWSPILPLCLSPPITVPGSGGTYRSSLWVFGGYPGTNTAPKFSISDIPGTYRAVWYGVLRSYEDAPFGPPLELANRVSNRFVPSVQPR